MTPAARYAAAITVLDHWLDGARVEGALTRWARGARYAGSGDRAAVRDHVYDVLRCYGTCQARGGGDNGRALVLGLLRHQGMEPDTVFSGEGHAAPGLTDAERAIGDVEVAADIDVPAWLRKRVEARMGPEAEAFCRAIQTRAPIFLRVNHAKASCEAAVTALAQDGITAQIAAGCTTALEVVEGARRIRHCAAFEDGLVELQDLSVQRAVAQIDWPTHGRILDFCAGGGGKSLAIAALTKAEIHAHDAHPDRMVDLSARADRAGVNIPLVTWEQALKSAPYDVVLCDVPCSGSGTWRRDPEAKWRLDETALLGLTRVQAGILRQAGGLVGPDGRLVYMTCSIFREENEDQVALFLADAPGWQAERTKMDTPLTASDGFFTAVLRKTG